MTNNIQKNRKADRCTSEQNQCAERQLSHKYTQTSREQQERDKKKDEYRATFSCLNI